MSLRCFCAISSIYPAFRFVDMTAIPRPIFIDQKLFCHSVRSGPPQALSQ
jgi:hypothetical protein